MQGRFWMMGVAAGLMASLGLSGCGLVERVEAIDAEHSGVDRGYEEGSQCRGLQDKLNDCRLGRLWTDPQESPDCDESYFEDEVRACQLGCMLNATCEALGRSLCSLGGEVLSECLNACEPDRVCPDGSPVTHEKYCNGVEDCADGSDEPVTCEAFMPFLFCEDPDFYERRYTESDDDDDD